MIILNEKTACWPPNSPDGRELLDILWLSKGDAIVVVEGCPDASMISCMSKLGMVTILTYHLRMQKLFK